MGNKQNVYEKARDVVRELVPVLQVIRTYDRSLADQLKRAAQSVVLNIAEGRGMRERASPPLAAPPRKSGPL